MARKRRNFSGELRRRNVLEVDRQVKRDRGTVAAACRSLGIHPSLYYRWRSQVQAYEDGDDKALDSKSKRPRRLARRLPEDVRCQIIALAEAGLHPSANAIAGHLSAQGRAIATATVIKVLREEGLYGVVDVLDDRGKVVNRKSGLIRTT